MPRTAVVAEVARAKSAVDDEKILMAILHFVQPNLLLHVESMHRVLNENATRWAGIFDSFRVVGGKTCPRLDQILTHLRVQRRLIGRSEDGRYIHCNQSASSALKAAKEGFTTAQLHLFQEIAHQFMDAAH